MIMIKQEQQQEYISAVFNAIFLSLSEAYWVSVILKMD